jgi:GNAT superfamily N-acetyltransferase
MLIIRAAVSTDLPQLAQIWQEKIVLQADSRFTPAAQRWIASASAWLTDPRCVVLTAEADGQPVGYAVGWIQPMSGLEGDAVGVITELAIDAHSYHAGVGRALADALRAWYAERGVSAIAAWASRRSAVEQAFWRSIGALDWMECLWIKS